jgi:hypothetical protein
MKAHGTFTSYALKEGRWYHIAITHHRQRFSHFSDSQYSSAFLQLLFVTSGFDNLVCTPDLEEVKRSCTLMESIWKHTKCRSFSPLECPLQLGWDAHQLNRHWVKCGGSSLFFDFSFNREGLRINQTLIFSKLLE